MPSPFPGMDPFLEDQHFWAEFHSKFMNWTQDTRAERVPEQYEVRIEERVSLTYEEDPEFNRAVLPHVTVLRQTGARSAELAAPSTQILTPVPMTLPMYQLEEVSDVYAWSIRDPLPTIPIPLLAPDPDIPLDLAAIFATVFQRGRYDRSIDYSAPLGLPLAPDDRTWAEELAKTARRGQAQADG